MEGPGPPGAAGSPHSTAEAQALMEMMRAAYPGAMDRSWRLPRRLSLSRVVQWFPLHTGKWPGHPEVRVCVH